MGWSIGYDENWGRDIGYGVPAQCDYPGCEEQIDRGLAYVCGGEPYGGSYGCGLYFCEAHLTHVPIDPETGAVATWDDLDERYVPMYGEDWEDCIEELTYAQLCERCAKGLPPFEPKPDTEEWTQFKMTDPSWKPWRIEKGLEQS